MLILIQDTPIFNYHLLCQKYKFLKHLFEMLNAQACATFAITLISSSNVVLYCPTSVNVSPQSCQQEILPSQLSSIWLLKSETVQRYQCCDALKLADVSAADINNKNLQQKVLQCLPRKGQRAFNLNDTASSYTTATTHAASVIDAGSSNQMCDLSPLLDQSSSSSARIKTKHRLNSKQKQEQQVADLAHWNS